MLLKLKEAGRWWNETHDFKVKSLGFAARQELFNLFCSMFDIVIVVVVTLMLLTQISSSFHDGYYEKCSVVVIVGGGGLVFCFTPINLCTETKVKEK